MITFSQNNDMMLEHSSFHIGLWKFPTSFHGDGALFKLLIGHLTGVKAGASR